MLPVRNMSSTHLCDIFSKVRSLGTNKYYNIININFSTLVGHVSVPRQATSRLSAIDTLPMSRMLNYGAQYLQRHYSSWVQQHGGYVCKTLCVPLSSPNTEFDQALIQFIQYCHLFCRKKRFTARMRMMTNERIKKQFSILTVLQLQEFI